MRPHADPEEDRSTGLTPPIIPRSPWRVEHLTVLANFRLRVRFNDGTEGEVDLGRLINSAEAGVFAALRDEALFQQAAVHLGAVTWPGDLDLAPDAMYRELKERSVWVLD